MTDMNKNRFWLKVGYLDFCGIFSRYNKIESCLFFVDLKSELQAVTQNSKAANITSATACLFNRTCSHNLNANKMGGTLYFWPSKPHEKYHKKGPDVACETISWLLPPCSPCNATLKDSEVLASTQYIFCYWIALWVRFWHYSFYYCFQTDFARFNI